MLQRPIDTRIEVLTPENIAFAYRLAGPFRRLPAYLIDIAVRTAFVILLFLILTFVFGLAGLAGLGVGLSLVVWFALEWFYGGLFETFWNGQTPGKRLLGLRVLSIDGEPVNGFQAVLRNVLRSVDAMPAVFLVPTYHVGLLAAGGNRRFQRLGDLAAGTMVVVEEPNHTAGVVRVEEPESLALMDEIPSSFVAGRSLTLALSTYVERRNHLSPARRGEIAEHLAAPLREKFALPAETDSDALLCAVYRHVFFPGEVVETRPAWATVLSSEVGQPGEADFSPTSGESGVLLAEPAILVENEDGPRSGQNE